MVNFSFFKIYISYIFVMVNFIYQLAWAMRMPRFWLNLLLGVSVRDEINIGIHGLWKPIVGLIQSTEGLHRTERWSWKNWLFHHSGWDSSLLPTSDSGWDWNFYHQLPWFPDLQTQTGSNHQLSWVFSLLASEPGTSQPLKPSEPTAYVTCILHKYYIYVFSIYVA